MSKTKIELTKQMLIDQQIEIFVDGHTSSDWVTGVLPDDNSVIEIYHKSTRGWSKLNSRPNVTKHPKGIKKECVYIMVSWSDYARSKKQWSIPMQRLLYAWFHGTAHAGLEIMHIDGNSLNNKVSNLKEGTHEENLAQRTGAINQYGLRKRDRNE